MREDIKDIPVYVSPKSDIIDLATNENYYGYDLKILNNEFDSAINELNMFKYGPDFHQELITAYGKYLNVDKNLILPGPGSESIIKIIIDALSDKNVLLLDQDFYRYEEFVKTCKREKITIETNENMYDNIIEKANKDDVELMFISNPNNPLGYLHKEENLLKILDNVKAYVVIDEAYFEYSNTTMIKYLDKYDNLIILKTLSKAWGLAGLRVGFAIANKKIKDYLYAVQGPFSVSVASATIAAKVLEHPEIMAKMVSKTIQQREKLMTYLKQYSFLEVLESYTNFIYVKYDKAKELQAKLLDSKILVNSFSSNGLRITVGSEAHVNQLIEVLDKILVG